MRLQNLGYAVTAHRAQGITTDTAHVLVEPTTTRENLYVAMTRGRESNRAYVILDRPDDHAIAHPGENPDATARTVLYGVLQHSGAELSAHEIIAAEQARWGSIAQLAAECETIAAAAQHDRWAALITSSGLTTDQAQAVIGSDAFGALTAELRRAEANHHNVDTLLPRLIKARGFADADDIASVIHHRLANATTRPAGSGRTRQAPRLIAGLIPEAGGPMTPDMHQALAERRHLIETRAEAVLDTALQTQEPWVAALGPTPADGREQQWRRRAVVVAAYRDRYQITDPAPLGAQPEGVAQKIDRARAETALRTLTRPTIEDERRRPAAQATRPSTCNSRAQRRGLAPSKRMVRDSTSCRAGYSDRSGGPATGAVCRVNSADSPGGWVARSAVSSSTSAAEVTRRPWPVRSSSCGP